MNLPFPTLTPKLVDSRWFNADNPCDEECEVALIEQKYRIWLTSIGQRYLNMNPLGKMAPEPMEEEAETDEEEGNDDSDDTEDTQDDEDDEEIVYAPPEDRGGMVFVSPYSIPPQGSQTQQSTGSEETPDSSNQSNAENAEAIGIAVVSGDNTVGQERSRNNNNDVVMTEGDR